MKTKVLIKIFLIIFFISSFISCSSYEMDEFEIQKYRGYKVLYKVEDNISTRDYYVLRNDSIAIELAVPTWFSELYSVGDTIK